MYGIVSGTVELRQGSVVVAPLGPDDVFGERAFIDPLPRNDTAVTAAETARADIDRSALPFLVHESSTFALGIMGALASRQRDFDEGFGVLAHDQEAKVPIGRELTPRMVASPTGWHSIGAGTT
ncbi:MAG TPA: cyclic nucleotide-binding domain-containing protein [Acidimicrobiales bacterium]